MMDKINLTEALKKLEEINQWFEDSDEVDVEEGLKKVKEGVKLVKESQKRLKDVENEFEEVKKELSNDEEPEPEEIEDYEETSEPEKGFGIEDIPF